MAIHAGLISPRIEALRKSLAAGDGSAIEFFWQEVVERGTPLIERIEADPAHCLVTFIWRGEPQLRNVVVVDGIAGENFRANQMTRLLDTDVWYRSYRARKDIRTVYCFSPNDPLLAEGDPGWVEHYTAAFQPDPFNPNSIFGEQSVLEMPGAAPETWRQSRPGAAAGNTQKTTFHSEYLQNERDVWIYTPPGYSPDQGPYAWIALLDGGAYYHMPTPTILDNLQADGRLPPIIAVMIGSLRSTRTKEYTCNPHFNVFLYEEFLPWIREQYPLSLDPRQATIGGFSYGGLAAAYAALQRPDVFGNVLAQSGCFWWMPGYDDRLAAPEGSEFGWLIRQFVKAPRLSLRFHLDAGILETDNKPGGVHANILTANRHLRDVLEAKGCPVHYIEFSGGHDLVGWRGVLPEALAALCFSQ